MHIMWEAVGLFMVAWFIGFVAGVGVGRGRALAQVLGMSALAASKQSQSGLDMEAIRALMPATAGRQ